MSDIVGVFVDGIEVPSGATFIIGLPSVGNVGQLAVDCTLCTLQRRNKLKYVGCLESSYVLPMTGYEVLGAGTKPRLCMPIEVYRVEDSDTFIIQQRSLCIKGMQRLYSASLLRWLQSVQFGSAVVLTGASTEDVELLKRHFHIATSGAVSPSFAALTEGTLPISAPSSAALRSISQALSVPAEVDIDDLMAMKDFAFNAADTTLPLGMTTARYLVEARVAASAEAASDVSGGGKSGDVLVVGKFVGEGDNIVDGLELAARVLNEYVLAGEEARLDLRQLVHPASWGRRYGGGITGASMFD